MKQYNHKMHPPSLPFCDQGDDTMFKPSRILVPTDMSDHSFKALHQALDIAQQYGSEIYILHVIRDPIQECAFDYCISSDLTKQSQAKMNESIRKGVQLQLDSLPNLDTAKITTDIKIGNPHHQILNEAEERNIDLIVIAPLGSSGLAKFMVGSIARHVLLGAKCPVLLSR
jgi:nucleotide-binding universal stress UspA family protein